MVSITEEAKAYEPKRTGNIVDLEKVSTATEVLDDVISTDEGDKPIKVVNVDGHNYRVPVTVLKNLKAILSEKPDLKFFKVTKTGQGMATEYTVIPLE